MDSKVQKPTATKGEAKPKAEKVPLRRRPDGKPLPPNAGKGRVAGVPNKATGMAREAISKLADGMTGEVQGWLRWVALGVGTAWAEWTPESDEDRPPPGSKQVGPKGAKIILAPITVDGRPTVTLQDVVDGKLPLGTVISWLVEPAPDAAGNTMLRALEYHIPKLGRIEHTDPDGKAILPSVIQVVGVAAPRREE